MISDHSGYPLPSYATTIWQAGDHICLALPSGPDSKAHVIRIPLAKCALARTDSGAIAGDALGWSALLEILKQRAALQERPVRLGDRAAPVQYDIDAMLRAASGGTSRRFDGQGNEQLDYDQLEFD